MSFRPVIKRPAPAGLGDDDPENSKGPIEDGGTVIIGPVARLLSLSQEGGADGDPISFRKGETTGVNRRIIGQPHEPICGPCREGQNEKDGGIPGHNEGPTVSLGDLGSKGSPIHDSFVTAPASGGRS